MPGTPGAPEQVYVVLRADLFYDGDPAIEDLVTAKEVLRSLELAEREAARLNALHPDGKTRYWVRATRLYPPGYSAGSIEPPA